MQHLRELLEEKGIQPSAQRLAVAAYVLTTDAHPSADQVWREVAGRVPMISRATVYNTLNLFVEKGLLRELHVDRDHVVFDPKTDTHHHFIDEETGRIYDVPWEKVQVCNLQSLRRTYDIEDYQVVMRGRKRRERKH
ncbi:MAG TPA: transcriptional repressor [Thermoanaerobaculia bacterium]|nr:transcriptional repressor [Thermoanaerobaculia bacterium]